MKAISDSSRASLRNVGISKHLKLLEDAGLVRFPKDGIWVDDSLTDGGNSPFVATTLQNLKHWLDDDSEISQLIEKLPSIRRENI